MADGALSEDGEVIGVIPSLETLELAPTLTKLFVTQGMHERKALMALVSGWIHWTLEDMAPWKKSWRSLLGINQCPLQTGGSTQYKGFYNGIIQWVDHAVRKVSLALLTEDSSLRKKKLDDLLYKMEHTEFVDLSSHCSALYKIDVHLSQVTNVSTIRQCLDRYAL